MCQLRSNTQMPRSLWTPFCPEGSLPFSLSLSLVHPFIQLCSVFRPLPLWFCKQVNRNLFLTQLSPQPCAPLATSPHLCQGSFALSLQLSFLYPHWWRLAPQPVSWLLPFPDLIVPLFWTSRPFGVFFGGFFAWLNSSPQTRVTSTLALVLHEFPYETQGQELFSNTLGLELVSCSSACYSTRDQGAQLPLHCAAKLHSYVLPLFFLCLVFFSRTISQSFSSFTFLSLLVHSTPIHWHFCIV